MTNETRIAGLAELEANEKLCEWMTERERLQSITPRIDGEPSFHIAHEWQLCNYRPDLEFGLWKVRRKFPRNVGIEPEDMPLFTECHAPIHRVLDAMTEEERAAYDFALFKIGPLGRRINFSTPAQKCKAAIRALGLANEEVKKNASI